MRTKKKKEKEILSYLPFYVACLSSLDFWIFSFLFGNFTVRCLAYGTGHFVGPFNMETSVLYFLFLLFLFYFHCSLWISWSDLILFSLFFLVFYFFIGKLYLPTLLYPHIYIYILKNPIIFLISKGSLYCSSFLCFCLFKQV